MPKLKPILIVDDDANDIDLVIRALKKSNLTNEIVATRHGGEALDYLYRRGDYADRQGSDPIFILLDLKMPKVDGVEVLRQIKADDRLKMIPIIMLTSSREEPDLLNCYGLGVNAYVVKPVDFVEFVEAIRIVGLFWALVNEPPPLEAVSRGIDPLSRA